VKLRLAINGEEKDIELVALPEECRFRMEGTERSATVAVAEPGVYSILIDGRSYDAHVDRTERGLVVVIAGHRFAIDICDPRRWSPKSASGGHGMAMLTSPMPGKVVRVLVAAGDTVEAGQGVLVVEAMKMQNEIKAPRPGVVTSLSTKEGATVSAGEPLATIG
jgi:biotin carboxyl carrier protein